LLFIISLPALTLVYVHELQLNATLIFPMAMAWLLFGAGCGFFWGVGRLLKLPSGTVGALTLTGRLGNTSFLGLPMIETYYGAQGLGLGILIDQVGTYLVLSTLGILAATYYRQEGSISAGAIVKKVLTFAPCISPGFSPGVAKPYRWRSLKPPWHPRSALRLWRWITTSIRRLLP